MKKAIILGILCIVPLTAAGCPINDLVEGVGCDINPNGPECA